MQVKFNTESWFNSKTVTDKVDQAKIKALSRQGAAVRTTAKRSMRYRTSQKTQEEQKSAGTRKRIHKSKPSKPGTPPHAIKPHPFMRKLSDFSYDQATESVVVGPLPFRVAKGVVPPLHEFGGTKKIRNPRRRKRRIGSGGEISVTGGKRKRVRYIKLRTAAQVARANRLNEQLYGSEYITGKYAPRPFMRPALTKVMARYPEFWTNSVSP